MNGGARSHLRLGIHTHFWFALLDIRLEPDNVNITIIAAYGLVEVT